MTLEITRPDIKDVEEIKMLFSKTLRNNFEQEGVLESHENELIAEIASQVESLKNDIRTNGKENYYLLAKTENKIVGTIAYGNPGSIIVENLGVDTGDIPEVKSVYILPKFQNKGIGTLLFAKIMDRLAEKSINEFYLDCGYKKAQVYWNKKLGKPTCILKNYWGEDSDHMIWHCRMIDVGFNRL